MSTLVEKAKIAAMSASLTKAWEYLGKNPEENVPKLMELVDKVAPDGWYEGQRNAFRKAIEEKSNWYELIMKVWNLDEGVRNTFFKNFIVNASLIEALNRKKRRKRKIAMCRGQFSWIRLLPATCIVPDAGLPSMAIA